MVIEGAAMAVTTVWVKSYTKVCGTPALPGRSPLIAGKDSDVSLLLTTQPIGVTFFPVINLDEINSAPGPLGENTRG